MRPCLLPTTTRDAASSAITLLADATNNDAMNLLDAAKDFLNSILGSPINIIVSSASTHATSHTHRLSATHFGSLSQYGQQVMAIDYDGIASFRTPISGIEITPAGYFFLLWFAFNRYGRNLGGLRDRLFAQDEDEIKEEDDNLEDRIGR